MVSEPKFDRRVRDADSVPECIYRAHSSQAISLLFAQDREEMKLLALLAIAVPAGAWVVKSLLDRAAQLREERMHYQFEEDDEEWWQL